jgi:glucose-6-phosphate 1-dehydrogenase
MSVEKIVKITPSDAFGAGEDLTWLHDGVLNIVVVGASGDLAKKKTFPSLLNLYDDNLLPDATLIWGYARSDLTDDELRDRLRPFLETSGDHSSKVIEEFLNICHYKSGKDYGDIDAFTELSKSIQENEQKNEGMKEFNRMFYFAIPPNVFADTVVAIKKTCVQDEDKGFTRVVVEKPFGRDTESFEKLNKEISDQFSEKQIYRIDHYLGKDMVQNLTVLRFSNTWFEKIWNQGDIQCVMLTFKEDFGTQGRGGYFDKYGIIRDVLQNHLMQMLSLLAMETPSTVQGPQAGKAIRDAKVAVLNSISPIKIEDCVLGQYEGYADDPSIENKDTNTPTFAVIKLSVNTPRWAGVPFIMKAGKALDERKSEMRIQFKDAPAASFLFSGQDCPRNELVMRLQPRESVYLKTNVKTPGFKSRPIQSELDINYDTRFFAHTEEANPDAYTRLLLDVLQGKQEAFVRDDELRRSWEIFTPLLHKIDEGQVKPIIYKEGTRGPKEADDFISREAGYIRNEDYVYYDGGIGRKTQGIEKLPEGTRVVAEQVPESEQCDIGLYGLAVMGQNFALNMASHGFKVCVSNRSPGKVDVTVNRAKEEGNLPVTGVKSLAELVAHLKKPRKLIILVQAGKPVDETINAVASLMEDGDCIIDGGNEWFLNSTRRSEFLAKKAHQFYRHGYIRRRRGCSIWPFFDARWSTKGIPRSSSYF